MKDLIISKRMEAVAGLVPPRSKVVADVGCDHAYVSIKLISDNIADKVIAMDVRKGPLSIAETNIVKYGVDKDIEIRLSDGLEKLSPDEADVIIIAGMGGLLMKSILERGKTVISGAKSPVLVLQPQSDIKEVRIFLYDNSYHIVREEMVFEDGKYYTAMLAYPGKEKPYDNEEDRIYGRYNIEIKSDILISYLKKESDIYKGILDSLQDNYKEGTVERRSEIENLLKINAAAQARCI